MKGTDFASFLSLDPYGAERIEVLRGPSSVLYGQNSPGGIINYVSKRPTDETFREIEVSAGSFDTYQGQFDMGGKLDEAGVWTYRLTGLAREGNAHIDYVEDDRLFIAPALKWQPDADTSLTLLATSRRTMPAGASSSCRRAARCCPIRTARCRRAGSSASPASTSTTR